MKRGIWVGLSMLTTLVLGCMLGYAAVSQDDTHSIPAIPDRVTLEDYRCVLVKKDSPTSWGCSNAPGGCYGTCYEGVYYETASICKPSPGGLCVGREAWIKVVRVYKGYCLSDCSCKESKRLDEDIVEIQVVRCN